MSSQRDSQHISFSAAVVVAVNAMIGVGVVAMPAVLALNVGPASIFSFLLSIVAVLSMGLSLGKASGYYPGPGWNYRYPSQWAGHAVGMISAFAYFIGVVIAMGFLVQQAGLWTHHFLPMIAPEVLSIVTLSLLTGLVLAGAEISSWGQYIIAFCVLTPLVLTSFATWANFNADLLTPFMPGGFSSIFAAMPTALFGLLGFETVASLYSVVEDPQRTVPRAFITAISIVGATYLLFVCGIIFSIPAEHFVGGFHSTLAGVLQQTFPSYRYLATGVLVGATFGIIGTLHSMIWSLSVLLNDVLALMKSSTVKRLLKSGWWGHASSVFVTAGLMYAVSVFFSAEWLMPLTALFIVPSYVLSSIALLFIPQEWRSGGNVVTLVAILTGLVLVYYASLETILSF